MTSEPGSAAMAKPIDDLVFKYGELCFDEGVEGRTHDTPDGDAARVYHEILSAFAVITRERDEARAESARYAELLDAAVEDYNGARKAVFEEAAMAAEQCGEHLRRGENGLERVPGNLSVAAAIRALAGWKPE